MKFRDLHVPSSGDDLGELMAAEGYTEADAEPPEPCGLCGHPNGDWHDDGETCPKLAKREECKMPESNC